MRRRFVLLFLLLLPFQLAWSAASGYCQHETEVEQVGHFGHHFHVHQSEPQKVSPIKLIADADCASCHAGAAAIPISTDTQDFAAGGCASGSLWSPPFTSVLARAPDRPQWPRLV